MHVLVYLYMPKGIERGQEKSAENNISVSIISFNGVMHALFTITMLIIYRYPTRISFCYLLTPIFLDKFRTFLTNKSAHKKK